MPAPAKLSIVYRDPKKLRGYAKNARTHSPEQVRQIRDAITEFGFTNPILLRDDGKLVGAGHGRLAAALLDPPLAQVPTIIIPGLTEDQWKAYVIADNKIGMNSGWDLDLLRSEMLDLRTSGFDLNLTGFGGDELKDLFKPVGQGRADPDYVPPVPRDPVSVLGDVWLLGQHRLTCGDCTDPAAVERALSGAKPHLMVTDPPYGVNYDPSWRTKVAVGNGFSKAGTSVGEVLNDDRADWREAWALFPGEVVYVWHGGLHSGAVQESLEAAGFVMRYQIIWNKQLAPMGRGDYHWKHEPCWMAVRKGGKAHYVGGRKQTTVWDIHSAAGYLQSEDKFATGHGTQKPIECMRRPIENNSKPGDRVYEPFNGSGSTLIACQMTKRIFHGVELNGPYVDVAVERWQAFTGDAAHLESTGQTYDEVKAERKANPPAPVSAEDEAV